MEKLNLGCGKIKKEGYINADIVKPADVIFDARKGIPYKDNNFERVEANNLMEHFNSEEFIFVMNEVWRVLKPQGFFWMRVPNAEKWFDGAAGDPTHKKFFTSRSFNYFQKGHPTYENYGKSYGLKGWELVMLVEIENKFFEWTGKKIVS